MQMKRKNRNYVAIGLAIFLMISGIWNVGSTKMLYAEEIIMEFAGGEGTVGTPYQITKLEHLNNVRNHLDKHFILMNNLDFANDSDYEQIQNKATWTTGQGWLPIGTDLTGFRGVFDGNTKVITGLMINRDTKYPGLFGYIDELAEIKDGCLLGVSITGTYCVVGPEMAGVGGLAGINLGTISNFGIEGNVAGVDYVGGLVGVNDGTLSNSHSHANVSSSAMVCGGLVGYAGGTINSSYATGNANAGTLFAGGLVGVATELTINNSYATGNVYAGMQAAGGLIGAALLSTVNNSYAAGGTVESSSFAGGLIGKTSDPLPTTINNSYYDSQTTGQTDTGQGTPRNTMEMKVSGTFTGWDFDSVWNIVSTETNISYPFLRDNMQSPSPGLASSTTKAITAFNFVGLDPVVTGTVDEDAKTIALWVPFGTDVTTLIPTIEHIGLCVSPNTGAAQDFTNPVTYTVTAPNTSTQDYVVTVTQLEFAGGEGTAETPYQITKLEHLNNVRNHLDKHYVLMNNLDFGEDSDYVNIANKNTWTTGEGWVPIGTSEARFTGVFDGNGKTITGIVIDRVASYQGMFRYTGEGAEIKNGSLKEINITGSDYVGGLAGYNLGTITNFSSDGNVSGVQYVGGLVGNNNGTINSSSSKAEVTVSDRFCGGLAGHSYGIINNSYATGNVTANRAAGGLLGGALTATINNSYATGSIHVGTQAAGGLIGTVMMSSINNSYATGSVTASTESAGGLIGSIFAGAVNNCYAVGSITEGAVSRGGLIGTSSGDPTINNSYYDSQNSGLSDTGKGTPKTTMEMKTSATFTGWDFGTVWNIINNETHLSYPYLRNNEQDPSPGYATKPSTSDGDSGDNSGDESRNNTPVNTDISVVAVAAIEKQTTTTSTGQIIENFTIQAGASGQIEKAKAEGRTSVQFNVESSQTSVTGINIPTAVIESAANMNIAINTPNATLELPAALVNALAAAGQDLSITVTRGGEVTNPEGATVVGIPTTINTDILGTTQVTIPLEGINIPVDPLEKEAFLASLAVFTLHSDGEEQLINGTIIYDESGNAISISFPVDKFSTFAIIKMSKKSISLTIDSNMATINGIKSTLDSGPYIDAITNRTLAPLRFIGEALGAKVEWLDLSRKIRITDGKKEIMLAIDSNVVYIDGQKMQIDCAPVIALSGRTFLPLRFVSESLGAEVIYNAISRQISIIREY